MEYSRSVMPCSNAHGMVVRVTVPCASIGRQQSQAIKKKATCFFIVLEFCVSVYIFITARNLFFVISMNGIVYREMESAALLALYSHACNEITHVDHVAQLTDITASLNALK